QSGSFIRGKHRVLRLYFNKRTGTLRNSPARSERPRKNGVDADCPARDAGCCWPGRCPIAPVGLNQRAAYQPARLSRGFRLRLFREQAKGQYIRARFHRYILLALETVGDRRSRNRLSGVEVPERRPAFSLERGEVTLIGTREDQATRCREQARAIGSCSHLL